MNVIRLISAELKAIVTKPHHIIVMLGVMCIPLIYGGMFLYGFWDVFGKSGNLPVAVVNHDDGAILAGKHIHAGADLVDELKDNKDFDWRFVSEKSAEDGFKKNRYFMVVTIPRTFSDNAVTLADDHLKPTQFRYQINSDYNFIAGRIASSGVQELQKRVSEELTKTYAKTMYAQINEFSKGLGNAASGSNQLTKGNKKVVDGIVHLRDGFKSLMNGTGQLKNGSAKLVDGADALTSGLNQVAHGTRQLYDQTSTNSADIAKLADGASTLADKLDELNAGAEKLAGGSGQLSSGGQSLSNGMEHYLKGLQQFQTSMNKEKDGIDTLNQQLSEAKPDVEKLVAAVSKLNDGADQLSSGIQNLAPYTHQLSEGMSSVAKLASGLPNADQVGKLKQASAMLDQSLSQIQQNNGSIDQKQLQALQNTAKQLNTGIQEISVPSVDSTQIKQLAEGAATIDAAFNQGINGEPSLVDASTSLAQGMNTLNNGMDQFEKQNDRLAKGVSQLSDGMTQLSGGQAALQTNFLKLVEGQARLASGMTELQQNLAKLPSASKALNGGANQLAAGNAHLNQTWPKLVSGIQTLQTGTGQLVSGSSKLAANMNTLQSGLNDLSSGQEKLAGGTNQLRDGAQNLLRGNTTLSSNLADAHHQLANTPTNDSHAAKFAEPVTSIDASHQAVTNFGTGFAPYFISLGLYVGAMLLTIVYDLGKPAGLATSGWNIAFSKFFITILMSLGQTLLIDAVVLKGLHLEVTHPWTFVGFTLLTSISYMAIIQWLAGSFNNEGRFVAVILLIVQLVSCGGAYAIQLIPEGLRSISKFVPMTYSVNGFRNIIDGHQQQMLIQNSWVLAGYAVLGLALSVVTFTIKFHLDQKKIKARNYENSTAG
ncbi:YhgE/Pip domain-containing protein [Sporolactobacillus terrae]|uniref:ABC-2 type transporter transmembrane domain-containing protein n=1 Tax=Sporolactobacillus terrae TaxID=269673 RepID=A0A5K7WXJ7_9BACL|nr:YhgE/Pip domain-containing protein [Sporolactobacillus terrae]BBN98414.1 hypothetical protein St703_11190 [Sporolactobacillus terrae]